jgi:uncharacterized protein with HEPN domain
MTRRAYTDYLRDIHEAAGYALEFVEGITFEEFDRNIEKVFAVLRALEIIGEASRQIPFEAQQQYPHLPWQEMIGMRNVLAHEYFGVDNRVVWRTVREDLPASRDEVGKIL